MEYNLNNIINNFKTAINLNFDYTLIPATKNINNILKIFYEIGYINGYTKVSNKFIISLKYINNKASLRQLFIISKPSVRTYLNWKQMKLSNTNNNSYTNSFIICNTSQGIMTDIEAIMLKIGGEPMLFVA